jgi:glycosyltransferase involved in cell wall biosynthesis
MEIGYTAGMSAAAKLTARLRALARTVPRFDIFHLHFGGLLPDFLDVPLLRALGKVVVVHLHGNDIREIPPPEVPTASLEDPLVMQRACMLPRQLRRRAIIETFADVILCSTADITAAIRGEWSPNPIELDRWRVHPPRPQDAITSVVHVPSDPKLRGTDVIKAAAEQIRASGHPIEIRILRDIPHQQMGEVYGSADLVLDQMSVGWPGMVALEAMASGRAVATLTFPWLARRFGQPPVVPVTREHLVDDLLAAHRNRDRLPAIAQEGLAYVREVHDARRVASQLLERYGEAIDAKRRRRR